MRCRRLHLARSRTSNEQGVLLARREAICPFVYLLPEPNQRIILVIDNLFAVRDQSEDPLHELLSG